MAHSIQNNRILSRISNQGQVYMMKPEFDAHTFDLDLGLIGRKVASVFTGFCNHHDTETFEPIENRGYVGDIEQNFAFAYRAFAFEYHIAQEAHNLVQIASPEFERVIQGYDARARDLAYYKRVFDEAILNSDFNLIRTVQLTFNGAINLAVCSCFHLEYDIRGNRLNDVTSLEADRLKMVMFNLFPQENETYALFSWLEEDADFYRGFEEQLLTLDPSEQLGVLNNLITLYCENATIGPNLWESFTREEQEAFLRIRKVTIMGTVALDDAYKMNLLNIPQFNLLKEII